MVNHFQGLVHIVSALETFQLSNDAAIGLLKGMWKEIASNKF